MELKEDTPERLKKRRYEEKNRDSRKEQNKVWGTSIPREFAEEVDAFLKANGLSKVLLIREGYRILQEQISQNKSE